MSGNTIGKVFTVTTFGESHGPAMGCIVDGCPPGMALAEPDLQADVDRRAFVRQRDIDFNGALADVCSRYSQCRFDGNAVFNTTFTVSDVSTRDYFHPSLSGQAKLAAGSWTVGYWGP